MEPAAVDGVSVRGRPAVYSLSLRALHQEGGQERHGAAGRSLLPARFPCRAGDIQMGPVVLAGESRQEARRGDGARRTPADIREIGEIALQTLLVVVP